jgi:hypothetical protein
MIKTIDELVRINRLRFGVSGDTNIPVNDDYDADEEYYEDEYEDDEDVCEGCTGCDDADETPVDDTYDDLYAVFDSYCELKDDEYDWRDIVYDIFAEIGTDKYSSTEIANIFREYDFDITAGQVAACKAFWNK